MEEINIYLYVYLIKERWIRQQLNFAHACWENFSIDQLLNQEFHTWLSTLDILKLFSKSSLYISFLLFNWAQILVSTVTELQKDRLLTVIELAVLMWTLSVVQRYSKAEEIEIEICNYLLYLLSILLITFLLQSLHLSWLEVKYGLEWINMQDYSMNKSCNFLIRLNGRIMEKRIMQLYYFFMTAIEASTEKPYIVIKIKWIYSK